MICWSCHEPVGGPVCVGCGAVQPLGAEPDLFAVLGVPRDWRLDPLAVDAAWRARSREVHPDRFAGRPAVERRMSLQWTAALNEARRILKNDLARARYLATGLRAAPETGGPRLDPTFLEEVFDLSADFEADPDAVRPEVERRYGALRTDLDRAFDTNRPEVVPELLARLQYLHNLLSPHGET